MLSPGLMRRRILTAAVVLLLLTAAVVLPPRLFTPGLVGWSYANSTGADAPSLVVLGEPAGDDWVLPAGQGVVAARSS